MKPIHRIIISVAILFTCSYASCKYSFKDISPIPADVKNFRVQPLGNKATYINPQLAPQLAEKLKQKIINTTRLRQTNADEANYDISGYISQYSVSTINITGNESSKNRLNVTFHLIFKSNVDKTKDFEADVTRTQDFDATLSLSEAENGFNDQLLKNLTEEIFNKIFSNW
jgi:hypothetical protein